jgi:hypothetical protein
MSLDTHRPIPRHLFLLRRPNGRDRNPGPTSSEIIAGLVRHFMIARSFFHHSDRARIAAFLARGWSLSLPHRSFVSGRLKTNPATQSVSVLPCFDATAGAAIGGQALNINRMMVAAASCGRIAGVQRP